METAVDLAVAELIASATGDEQDKATLVAGQALALWGEFYEIEASGVAVNPLASKDVDFFEQKRDKVSAYINSIRIKLNESGYIVKNIHWADLADSTPEVAKLILASPAGEELIVDFLGHVGGLTAKQINDKSIVVDLDDGKCLRVLHPIECLKARIHNLINLYPSIYSDSNNEKIEVERIRVNIALEIVRRYFMEQIIEGTNKKTNKELAELCKFGCSQHGKKLLRKQQLSIADAIPEEFIDIRFREHNYQQLIKLRQSILG